MLLGYLETIINSLLLLLFSLTAAPGSPLCPGGPCRNRNLPWGCANKSCGEEWRNSDVHTTGPTLPSPGDPLSPGGPCSPLAPGGPWGNSNTDVTTLLLKQFGKKRKSTKEHLSFVNAASSNNTHFLKRWRYLWPWGSLDSLRSWFSL